MDKKTMGKPVYINPRDIPPRKKASFEWEIVFDSIPDGMTRVFHDEAVYCTVASALKRMKKMGKFENCKIETRKEGDKRVTYVTKLSTK